MRIYPLEPLGAAEGTALMTGPVTLSDDSRTPRFGLKGRGTVSFLQAQGYAVPEVNRISDGILRLGREEAVVLNHADDLRTRWDAAAAPKGYYSWREETWAMMHLSGPHLFDLMAKICPLNLAEGAFAQGEIAQTRVGYVEAITWRDDRGTPGFSVLFDISATAFFANAVTTAAGEFVGETA